MKRILFCKALAIVAAAGLGASGALAQGAGASYPSNRITLVVPYAPGGQTDNVARMVAAKMAENLKQPVIVENRPGAGGALGTKLVASSPPDGYTVLLNTAATHILPMLSASAGYDPATQLRPIAQLTSAPMLLAVKAESPWKSVRDMVGAASDKGLNYSSSGVGSANHLAAQLLAMQTGANMTHVPYRGGPQVTQAVVAGEVDFAFDTVLSVMPLAKGGRLRILGATAPSTLPQLADIPVLPRSGYPEVSIRTWSGVYVAAGTPDAVAHKLENALKEAIGDPAIATRLTELGSPADFKGEAEFRKQITEEGVRFGTLIQRYSIRAD